MITPLLEGTDGVQKMSKSLGNYIGIDESPSEIFGKVMSISDDLMWRYHELLTDLTVEQIAALRSAAGNGERNPRDVKVELAKAIIADFHSPADAARAEEEFNQVFRNKQAPSEIEERIVAAGEWTLPRLLVETGLAPSMSEARRLIEGGGVTVAGQRCTVVNTPVSLIANEPSVVIQVGKRRFIRVGAGEPS